MKRLQTPSAAFRAGFLPLVVSLVIPLATEAQRPAIRLVPQARIGIAEGDPRLTFGTITSVATDAAGRIYVLDGTAENVRVFSPQARFIQELGRSGRGPGELFRPQAVTVDASGRAFVLNAGNQRVEVYHRNGDRLEHQGAFRLDFSPGDMCSIGDRLYLLGTRSGELIHEFDHTGRRTRSFGEPPGGGDALMTASVSAGRITCDAAADRILYLPNLLPEVHGFSARTGERVWVGRIPGYDAVTIRRNSDGSITLRAGPSRTHDVGRAVSSISPGYALVQIGALRQGARSAEDVEDNRSFMVSLATGTVTALPASLPRLMGVAGRVAFMAESDPFPSLRIYHVEVRRAEGTR